MIIVSKINLFFIYFLIFFHENQPILKMQGLPVIQSQRQDHDSVKG